MACVYTNTRTALADSHVAKGYFEFRDAEGKLQRRFPRIGIHVELTDGTTLRLIFPRQRKLRRGEVPQFERPEELRPSVVVNHPITGRVSMSLAEFERSYSQKIVALLRAGIESACSEDD